MATTIWTPHARQTGIRHASAQRGALPTGVFLLTEGLALLTSTLPAKTESVLGIRLPGQVIEQCAHALTVDYPVSARIIVRSEVLRVSVAELRQKEKENPAIQAFFRRALASDLFGAAVFITQLKNSTPAERLEHLLRLLGSAAGGERTTEAMSVPVPLHDDQIADIIGVSTRQLVRVKKQMSAAGHLEFPAPHLWRLT